MAYIAAIRPISNDSGPKTGNLAGATTVVSSPVAGRTQGVRSPGSIDARPVAGLPTIRVRWTRGASPGSCPFIPNRLVFTCHRTTENTFANVGAQVVDIGPSDD